MCSRNFSQCPEASHSERSTSCGVEQAHLAAEPAVVALLGLLQHAQVGLELFFGLPAGAGDALELLVLGVAAPVGAGNLEQFERLA